MTAVMLVALGPSFVEAQRSGFSWVEAFLQTTVTYKENGRTKKVKVLSGLISYCMWDNPSGAIKNEFESTVRANYSAHEQVAVSSPLWGFSGADVRQSYARALSSKDGHDEVVSNGYTYSGYTSRCK
jgi:hypothetical protein